MTITLYEAIKYFDKPNKHGLQPFKRDREWGLRHKAEKRNVVRNTYSKVKSKHPNSYYLAQRNNKWALISPEGERLTPLKYVEVEETSNSNYVLARNYKGFWGVIDAKGNVKLPFENKSDGKLFRPAGGHWFDKADPWQQTQNKEFFDKDFNPIKISTKVEIWISFEHMTGSFYEVENHLGEKGVWDKSTNSMKISFGKYGEIWFEKAAYGNPPYFLVKDQHYNEGIVDLNDNILLAPNYDNIEPLAKFNLFDVSDYGNDSGGIFNLKTNSWVIPYSKQNITPYFTKNGLFFVVTNTKGKSGLMKYNEQTNIAKGVVPQAFSGGINYRNGTFECGLEGKKGSADITIKYSPTKGFQPKHFHTIIKSIF